MICQGCSSVIIVQAPDKEENGVKYYFRKCPRCQCEMIITVTVKTKGNETLIEKYKTWLNQDAV